MDSEQQIYRQILEAENILLVTHYNPDGDALSSITAMADILITLDKSFTAYCKGPLDDSFNFLPRIDMISNVMSAEFFNNFDLIISLDCGSVERTGIADLIINRCSDQYFAEIDHHPKMEQVSNFELRRSTAASTTEIIHDFCQANGIKITANLATCILTGLATDTGNFIYPSTNRKSIAIAAEMLWRGARLPQIIREAFYRQNMSALKIWGLAMSRLTINPRYQIAYTVLSYRDYEEYGADETMTDELAGWLACLEGVKAVLFLKESRPGLIKGSWRAVNPSFDVARIARALGGGGHVKAAGFAIKGSLVQVDGHWLIE